MIFRVKIKIYITSHYITSLQKKISIVSMLLFRGGFAIVVRRSQGRDISWKRVISRQLVKVSSNPSLQRPIAVITVISGLVYKRGERISFALY